MTPTKYQQQGLSLIELIVFIVILGLMASMLFTLYATIIKGGSDHSAQTVALQFARSRMALLQQSVASHGFTEFSDPCDRLLNRDICRFSNRIEPKQLPLANHATSQLLQVIGYSRDRRVSITLTARVYNDA